MMLTLLFKSAEFMKVMVSRHEHSCVTMTEIFWKSCLLMEKNKHSVTKARHHVIEIRPILQTYMPLTNG